MEEICLFDRAPESWAEFPGLPDVFITEARGASPSVSTVGCRRIYRLSANMYGAAGGRQLRGHPQLSRHSGDHLGLRFRHLRLHLDGPPPECPAPATQGTPQIFREFQTGSSRLLGSDETRSLHGDRPGGDRGCRLQRTSISILDPGRGGAHCGEKAGLASEPAKSGSPCSGGSGSTAKSGLLGGPKSRKLYCYREPPPRESHHNTGTA